MRATVYDCTQKRLIGYYIDIDIEAIYKILNEKHGTLCKEILEHGNECVGSYHFNFDILVVLSPRKFVLKNSNMSIWCKTNQNIPMIFGNRSFIIRKDI